MVETTVSTVRIGGIGGYSRRDVIVFPQDDLWQGYKKSSSSQWVPNLLKNDPTLSSQDASHPIDMAALSGLHLGSFGKLSLLVGYE
jgi:hypothetical protein